MQPTLKRIALGASCLLLTAAAVVTKVHAADPDGLGPWADTVVTSAQGLRKDGTPVLAARSNPLAALGVAENDTVSEHFYSLGFGGSLTLGFENGVSSGAFVVEATNPGYPSETIQVALSRNGVDYTNVGTISQDGAVQVPEGFGCALFVRLTDVSNPADFADPTADAYDVDGVQAQGLRCQMSQMTGGGSIILDGTRLTHGFNLDCDPTNGGNLQMNWGKGNKFHLENLTSALCVDDPALNEEQPVAGFDTYMGSGTGRYNGVSGYSVNFTFTDDGEPGTNDMATIEIKDPANNVVYSTNGFLKNGNHQAHH